MVEERCHRWENSLFRHSALSSGGRFRQISMFSVKLFDTMHWHILNPNIDTDDRKETNLHGADGATMNFAVDGIKYVYMTNLLSVYTSCIPTHHHLYSNTKSHIHNRIITTSMYGMIFEVTNILNYSTIQKDTNEIQIIDPVVRSDNHKLSIVYIKW